MSKATPAVITAALGLMVGYDSAVGAAAPSEPVARNERHQDLQRVADNIHSVISDARALEATYTSLVKRATNTDIRAFVSPDDLGTLEELLKNLRGVEVGLKGADVPAELMDLHMQVRRAIAKGRSRVAAFYSLAWQAYTEPKVVAARASGEGLRSLADHTTRRLVELANA
ncbi:hypothetical protein SAMN05216198_1037 [Halopseudomonas litoralis]|uniref:Uncharacterized protein n=1 Tax=Halopseudomonas litoralis TaxID=797277 RepID=A0A1H1NXI3_9GAMM|nr:hypothetical protein [Halopseudomonas litoralis]SDS03672.1 hypothetical protein SAMN05216198_1037 [Halopseudomonas litoralis]